MMINRRRLLTAPVLAGASALLGACGEQSSVRQATREIGWGEAHSLFRLARRPPLNAANLCPAFAAVLDRQAAYAARLNEDVGFINRRDFVQEEIAAARAACAQNLGLADADSLAFVRNTSEANALIVQGLDLAADDEVVLWDENHATNYRSWHYRRGHPRLRRVQLPVPLQDAGDAVAAFRAALTPRTRIVSFSHLSNLSGTRLPAAEICRAVHDFNPDIFVYIDGAQSWGSMEVDLDAIGCDGFGSSGHKWLCGPRGTGVLMVRSEWAGRIRPLINAYDFAFDYPEETLGGGTARFERLGQRDTAACAALGTAAEMHLELGPARIEARIAALTGQFRKGFEQAGFQVRTPSAPALGHGVVAVDVGGSLRATAAFLALHNAGYAAAFVHGNRVHCAVADLRAADHEQTEKAPVFLRVCPHIYNEDADVQNVLEVVRRVQDSPLQMLREMLRFLS